MSLLFKTLVIFFLLLKSLLANDILVTSATNSLYYSTFSMNLSNAFSIQSWMRAYDSTNTYGWAWMIGGNVLGIGNVDGSIEGLVNNSSVVPSGSTSVTYNSWVHTVLTYNGAGTYVLYINGNSHTFTASISAGAYNGLNIGGKSNAEQFNGDIDKGSRLV